MRATRRLALGAVFVVAATACRGEPRETDADRNLAHLVDSLMPAVEQSTGLRFKRRPESVLRSRDEVRSFVRAKLAQEMPPERFLQLTRAYTLLGLLPDSLDLRAVMEDMLSQQIAGYYDPDSATLYGVVGAEGPVLRLTVAHELVHALQDQYMPLDSILKDKSSNDRSAAAQAILEGQANYASIVMLQGAEIAQSRAFWDEFRKTGDQMLSGGGMGGTPAVLREGLLFPYLAGAEFMLWWGQSPFRDTLPYGPRMPRSTEQIMHPERYERGDNPLNVRFTDSVPGSYEDVLGEFDIRLLMQELTGRKASDAALPLGWGGDRFRLDEGNGGPALVWISLWDEPRHRDWFESATAAKFRARAKPGYRAQVDTMTVDGRAGLRYAIGREGWAGWQMLPGARVPNDSVAPKPIDRGRTGR
jgi:hypothetical protein